MIDFFEARDIVQGKVKNFGVEIIPLAKAIGRVNSKTWQCDRDLPPYDRVSMDGIAINYPKAIGKNKLKIAGVVAAGDVQSTLENAEECLEIMTGAVLPNGSDTIIRYEDLTIEDGFATINVKYAQFQNVHTKAKDRKEGELLIPANTLLSASEIGVAASIGKHEVEVYRLPKTIVISTGNELVEVHETPKAHQIRRGNVYRIQATLNQLGLEVTTAHLKDDKEEIIRQLAKYIEDFDLIIMSGGVSKGKFDYLPLALERCGVEKHFHRVAQRPGKPLWFGTHENGTTVFALPGNPISSFMCLNIYVMDWLRACQGLKLAERPKAELIGPVHFKPDLTYFMEVAISYGEDGRLLAEPKRGNGSGDLANLVRGDAFVRLPRGREEFGVGEVFEIYWYR